MTRKSTYEGRPTLPRMTLIHIHHSPVTQIQAEAGSPEISSAPPAAMIAVQSVIGYAVPIEQQY